MAGCALAALLRAGGPVRVAVRPCCVVTVVGRPRTGRPLRDFVCSATAEQSGRDAGPAGGFVAVPAGTGAGS